MGKILYPKETFEDPAPIPNKIDLPLSNKSHLIFELNNKKDLNLLEEGNWKIRQEKFVSRNYNLKNITYIFITPNYFLASFLVYFLISCAFFFIYADRRKRFRFWRINQ